MDSKDLISQFCSVPDHFMVPRSKGQCVCDTVVPNLCVLRILFFVFLLQIMCMIKFMLFGLETFQIMCMIKFMQFGLET